MQLYLKIIFVAGIGFFSCKQKQPVNDPLTTQSPKPTGKKQIFFTFDDGPTTGSKKLYELLKQEQIPATLYLVGKHYENMPGMHSTIDSLRNLPFIVMANHSYSHAYDDHYLTFYNDVNGVIADYTKAQTILHITSGIARCAGRNVWRTATLQITDNIGPGTAMDSLYTMGYQFTGWDCTWPYDYKTFKNKKDVAGMLSRIKLYFDSSYTKTPGCIVILGHDQQFADAGDFQQLRDFIDTIKHSTIYEFANMANYPGIKKQ
jgi:peptidoglycan/xylan/chitin deacetylase (PgdA/CDA1 family)